MSKSQEPGGDYYEELRIKEIVPERVQLDSQEKVVILFNRPLPTRGQYSVDFVNAAGRAKQVPAKLLNSDTLILCAPVYVEADTVTAHVYHGINRSLLGRHPFEFLSRSDMLYKLLHEGLDPITFMCEALDISPVNIHGLDRALAETFNVNVPEGFRLLGMHKDIAAESKSLYPTLLHFAAEFGLSKLIRSLEQCPGALEACSIKNCFGHRPYNIADEHGFSELADQLRAFHDKDGEAKYVDTEEDIYQEMEREDGTYVYVPVKRGGSDLRTGKRYVNVRSRESDDHGYVSTEGVYQNLSDQDQEEQPLYESMQKGGDNQEDFYQTMDSSERGENQEDFYTTMEPSERDDVQDELYIAMEEQTLPERRTPGYPIYDRPTSNQPVHRNDNFYRSASSAAEIRAKELAEAARARKTQSLPAHAGTYSETEIIRRHFQQSVRSGLFTEEQARITMQQMGISNDEEPQPIPRTGSTGSRTSSSTNTSGYSAGSSNAEDAEYQPQDDADNSERTHMTHAELIKAMATKQKVVPKPVAQEEDSPPTPPRRDYDERGHTLESPRPSTQRHHKRFPTSPVDRRDFNEAYNTLSSPPPLAPRRQSEPHAASPIPKKAPAVPTKSSPDPRQRAPAPLPNTERQPPPKPAPRIRKP